jgi:hypothetical protein
MFDYSDPVGRDFLGNSAAKDEFGRVLQGTYEGSARRNNSAFTWLEAFGGLSGGQTSGSQTVAWRAFPLTAGTTDKNIDADRLQFQDEYVEWLAEEAADKPVKVTFTTEFSEYFEAFAAVGLVALAAAIQDAMPGASPTAEELFGPEFDAAVETPLARSQTFRRRLARNPWNNGEKGILCLTQQFNTLGALFKLLTECGVPRSGGAPENTCSLVGGHAEWGGVRIRRSARWHSRPPARKSGIAWQTPPASASSNLKACGASTAPRSISTILPAIRGFGS